MPQLDKKVWSFPGKIGLTLVGHSRYFKSAFAQAQTRNTSLQRTARMHTHNILYTSTPHSPHARTHAPHAHARTHTRTPQLIIYRAAEATCFRVPELNWCLDAGIETNYVCFLFLIFPLPFSFPDTLQLLFHLQKN